MIKFACLEGKAMLASTRTFKVASSVLSYASRSALSNQIKILQLKTTRSCSILSRLRSSSSVKVLGAKKINVYSKTCSCAIHHKLTEGDHDLVNFLDQEIEYEKEALGEVPKMKDFKLSIDGSHITLSRKHNGERILVTFDVNENVNIDESMNADEMVGNEDEVDANIVSYPTFKVQIIKDGGKTLQFYCAFNTSPQEDDDDVISDIFRFDSVSVWQHPDAQEEGESSYEAETENMDGSLYKLLHNTLYERGINNEFAKELLQMSTTVEHKEYVNFLQDLKGFFSAKH